LSRRARRGRRDRRTTAAIPFNCFSRAPERDSRDRNSYDSAVNAKVQLALGCGGGTSGSLEQRNDVGVDDRIAAGPGVKAVMAISRSRFRTVGSVVRCDRNSAELLGYAAGYAPANSARAGCRPRLDSQFASFAINPQ